MTLLTMPPQVWYLELALISLTVIAGMWAYALMRSTRRRVDPPSQRPAHLPSTALTRETRKQRTRPLARV